jgi:hypothetical protein
MRAPPYEWRVGIVDDVDMRSENDNCVVLCMGVVVVVYVKGHL